MTRKYLPRLLGAAATVAVLIAALTVIGGTSLAAGSDTLHFHVSDSGSGISIPDIIVTVDGTQEEIAVTASGDGSARVSGLRPGRHRLVITASDLQETKNSENASALALPNTRTVHVAFTVGGTG